MYHTSPNLILDGTIHNAGIAGSCIFFSDDVYYMSEQSIFVYEAEFNCVGVGELYDPDIISEIQHTFNVCVDIAERLLDGSDNEWNHEITDGELSWWLQGKRGECAVIMGFDGCEDIDEQGTVYIIPMIGREGELSLC